MILLLPPAAAPAGVEGTAGICAVLCSEAGAGEGARSLREGGREGGAAVPGVPLSRGAACCPTMGKDQELLEAARTGNVALVEKLLSGRKGGILGSGSGAIPLSSLLR